MIRERDPLNRIVDVSIYGLLALLALMCAIPFIHVLAVSLSEANAVITNRVGLMPINTNFDNYVFVLRNSQFLDSFFTSVVRVVVGVTVTVSLMVITAYPLSLDRIEMPGRTFFKFLLLFGALFSGGLIPTFLAYRNLGLINSFWVLILPTAINVFQTIIIINFFRAIPSELPEAAMLDGASHWQILTRVYLPVSVPAIATVALFTAVGHWNEWFSALVYLSRVSDWPLQTYLYSLLTQAQMDLMGNTGGLSIPQISPEGIQAAFIFVSTVPILLVYPFMQRYFVTGLTLGSVKG